MKKQVAVLVGAGSIGQAIIRRVSAGKHIVLADYSEENANGQQRRWKMQASSARPSSVTLVRRKIS